MKNPLSNVRPAPRTRDELLAAMRARAAEFIGWPLALDAAGGMREPPAGVLTPYRMRALLLQIVRDGERAGMLPEDIDAARRWIDRAVEEAEVELRQRLGVCRCR